MKEAKKHNPQPLAIPMDCHINMLTATLDLPLRFHQISRLRGALVEAAGRAYDLLHNHKAGDKQYKYRYPLIQYRVHKGRAMLVGLEEGADVLREVLLKVRTIHLEGQDIPLRLYRLQEKQYHLRLSKHKKTYRLQHWLALNQENYEKWLQLDRYIDRIALLEKILTGHILSFTYGMKWHIPNQLEVHIKDIPNHSVIHYHNTPLIAFDVVYKANIELPALIGLGKAVSHGFGWQIPHQMKR